ncbi:hypothetical protein GQX73_g379 [Xylaria multiplex]|uniref:S-adenosyl-L-methionine-dependent N-methyltransferase n=1 Tax=Xylaria multiplex TaxID=323545 RepID=A0A7C8MTG9_9PEZI|nr:hypothetical protein GQX73_g379 [Xylaria multiplex]
MTAPLLTIFGPQTTIPESQQLNLIRGKLLGFPELESFAAAIEGIDTLWPGLVEFDSRLQLLQGPSLLRSLAKWITTGNLVLPEVFGTSASTIPNVLLTPLTLIFHGVELFTYISMRKSTPENCHQNLLPSGHTRGLCCGLLAATSLSVSRDTDDLVCNLTVALRLAVIIGAYVDLDDGFPGWKWTSYAIRWKHTEDEDDVMAGIGKFPHAYISVRRDTNIITVTVDNESSSSFSKELSAVGACVRKLQFGGRFHTPSHADTIGHVRKLCELDARLQFKLGKGGSLTTWTEPYYAIAQEMLVERSEWHTTLQDFIKTVKIGNPSGLIPIACFGLVDSIPRAIASDPRIKLVKPWISNFEVTGFSTRQGKVRDDYDYPEDAIAIVGAGCRLPGSDSIADFWKLLLSKTTIIGPVPETRFDPGTLGRESNTKSNLPFLGSYLTDPFAFDHGFFGRSPREAASMDPQQRMILQVAYQALESAAFFSQNTSRKDVGCYIGVATGDYDDNVASHSPTAFSAIGTLRAFIAGKISHFFGFEGPSMVFDTACSSSMVAIHTACAALRAGDCNLALAGGVNAITSPNMFQNLAAANFLSPSGASKAFDSLADGYCRGEGAGLLVLKKLGSARADGDDILAVVAGSAVNQNQNSSPITVPVCDSQTALYNKILMRSRLSPTEISYVEAHGTGTPKGDPIESVGICQKFGYNPARKLYIGSVKGNIGHGEAVSGVASIIKVILMMHHRIIPPQASFETLNPNIPSLEEANVEIAREPKTWSTTFLAAAINNYGASGSNAAMILCEPPRNSSPPNVAPSGTAVYPVMVTAKSPDSLRAYVTALLYVLDSNSRAELSSIAYGLTRRLNLDLPYYISAKVRSITELRSALTSCKFLETKIPKSPNRSPVIMVFSGQTGRSVSISREAYDSYPLLRKHLDRCDDVVRSMGITRLLPRLFDPHPYDDVVQLHCATFSMQYACAQAWLDAGLKVEAMIGHSFGELTALCVAEAWNLEQGLYLIAQRAKLIVEKWGEERGSMLLIDADRSTAESLVARARECEISVEIACYNSPTKHVVVGSESDVTGFESMMEHEGVARRRLSVTHGFHSVFVDNLMNDYRQLTRELRIRTPKICVETCSPGSSWNRIGAELVAEQFRRPVYFKDAVERIRVRHGPCTFIEAGSCTAAMSLVRNALQGHQASSSSPGSLDSLIPITLNGDNTQSTVLDATIKLWSSGINVQFWPFHQFRPHLTLLAIPPYQFELHHHVLRYTERRASANSGIPSVEIPTSMVTLVKFIDNTDQQVAMFTVQQEIQPFPKLVQGHNVLGSPLCPVSLYIEIAARCIALIYKDTSITCMPNFQGLAMVSPLGLDPSRQIRVVLTRCADQSDAWTFELSSLPKQSHNGKEVRHASSKIIVCRKSSRDAAISRCQRLIDVNTCTALLFDPRASSIQGPPIYRLFERVVKYDAVYQGVQHIAAKEGRVAGIVSIADLADAPDRCLVHPLAVDNFIQVAGLHVNALREDDPSCVYICSQIEDIYTLENWMEAVGSWLVYSICTPNGNRELLNDIFVLDAATKSLTMMIIGCRFTKTPIEKMRNVLARVNVLSVTTSEKVLDVVNPRISKSFPTSNFSGSKTRSLSIRSELCNLLQEVTGVDEMKLHDEDPLSTLGIDSLMAVEVISAIMAKFGVDLPIDVFDDSLGLGHLCDLITTYREPDSSNTSSSDETKITIPSPITLVNDVPPRIKKLETLVADCLNIASPIPMNMELFAAGVDSLLAIELAGDIEREFGVAGIDFLELGTNCTYQALINIVFPPTDNPVTVSHVPRLKIGAEEKSHYQRQQEPATPIGPLTHKETIQFHEVDGIPLFADIYYPDTIQHPGIKRPIALMIHGGGHVLLSRSHIRPRQTALLLSKGFLPVSIDYRLCPEVTLPAGPMADTCAGFNWCRTVLPTLKTSRPDICPDGDVVVAVGWSTGGTLAMTLPFTAPACGIRPPDAILAFYCPTDYEDEHWTIPNYPEGTTPRDAEHDYDLRYGVQSSPITSYKVPRSTLGGWCSREDARSLIVLHMNWKGQTLPILLDGLPIESIQQSKSSETEDWKDRPQPDPLRVQAVSPYAQILKGTYKTPTFLIHGTEDDLVPWQQSARVSEALVKKGVPAGIEVVEGGLHLFDLHKDVDGRYWDAVMKGYQFLFDQTRV